MIFCLIKNPVFRSQGTLSDLLRNPKPWNKLKSGRETFRRMFNWVQQPLELRLGILDMYKEKGRNILDAPFYFISQYNDQSYGLSLECFRWKIQ